MLHMVGKYMSLPCRKGSGLGGNNNYRLNRAEVEIIEKRRNKQRAAALEKLKKKERSRIEAKQEELPKGSKDAAIGILTKYAESIGYYEDLSTGPDGRGPDVSLYISTANGSITPKEKEQIGNALVMLGSDGFTVSDGGVSATGSFVNTMVVAEEMRKAGIKSDQLPLPAKQQRYR